MYKRQIVYDVTKPQSFIKARHWIKELHEQANKDMIIALVGNKVDVLENNEDERKVAREEGEKLAEEEGLLFFETSAKTGLNVTETFVAIGEKIPLKTAGDQETDSNGVAISDEQRIDLANSGNAAGQTAGCSC